MGKLGKSFILTILMVIVSYTTARPNWKGNPDHLLSENDYIDENSGRYQGNAGHLLSENDYIDENPKKSRHRRMVSVRYTTARPNWEGNPNHLLSENDYIDENSGRYQGNANHLLSENDYIDENSGRYQGNAGHLLSENDYIDENPKKSRHRRMVSVRYTTARPNWKGNPNHLLSENDYIDENSGRYQGNADHLLSENDYIDEKPMKLRNRREVQTNPDDTKDIKVKYPLATGEKNVLNAVVDVHGVNTDNKSFKSASGGLELDNINGHKFSLTGKHTPNVGNEVTAAGKVQLLDKDHHDLSANAFATRDMPSNPAEPSTNTFGGSLDYNFNNKNSLSLSGKHNPKGSEVAAVGKMEILHDNHHDLTANAFASRIMPSNPALPISDNFGGGLDYTFDKKNSLSLTGKHISNLGSEAKVAGSMNMFHNDNHDLFANAFASRTMPSNPTKPAFDTFGGGLDYTYRDKIGASLDVVHVPLRQQTDFSALSHLNLYRDPTTTFDFNAGVSKSFSPFVPTSSWQPFGSLSFTKNF